MPKFKSIIATSSSVILIPLDNSKVITLSGSNLINTSDLIAMISNINRDGFTELVVNNSPDFDAKINQWLKDNQMVGVDLTEVVNHAKQDIETGENYLGKFIARLNATDNSPELNQAIIEFVGRSGMSLTIDGAIIGFRTVSLRDDKVVDTYTGKIPQLLHSIVYMDHDRVDNSMSRSCSRGLHVASIDYVSSYSGDICHVVLVEPEHIIAVPYNDRNKMRVCQYSILEQLSEKQYKDISNKVMSTSEKLLKPYLEGYIPAMLYRTHETDGSVTEINTPSKVKKTVKAKVQVAKADPKEKKIKPTINLKEVRMTSTFAELLRLFLTETKYANKVSRYNDLLVYKRKQKKSWASLGASVEEIKALKKMEK